MAEKKNVKVIFIIYSLVMLWLLFGQRWGFDYSIPYFEQINQNINLIPFETIHLFWNMAKNSSSGYMTGYALVNLAGNIIMFIPLGLLPCIFEKLKNFKKYLLTVITIIFLIEVIQLFSLLGSCDIDDLMLNVVGAVIGYLVIKIIKKFTVTLKK